MMQPNKPIAIVDGVRTPFAKAFGAFIDVTAVELGQTALEAVLLRCGLSASDIDEVVFGNVAGPPDSANVARVIALKAGVPHDRIAHTVNRNCASGMESIFAGCSRIREGRATTIVAGGTESMSQIPMLLSHEAAKVWLRLARSKSMLDRLRTLASMRPRHFKPVVGIELGLTDPVSGLNMGETAEVLAKEFHVTRDQQDAFAMESHRKASEAQEACFLSGEVTGVTLSSGETIERDNGPRKNQTLEQLGRLRPLFGREGTITAGNSCPLTDGAAALVLSDPDKLDQFSRPPLGYITAYSIAGCDPRRMGLGPVYATAKLFAETGMSFADFDHVEINEAFAAQVLACERAFGSKGFAENEWSRSTAVGELPMDRVNVHGGAIALGHPVGTSGTRLVLTLLRTLKANGKQRGLATLCVGGGQGVAIVVESVYPDPSGPRI